LPLYLRFSAVYCSNPLLPKENLSGGFIVVSIKPVVKMECITCFFLAYLKTPSSIKLTQHQMIRLVNNEMEKSWSLDSDLNLGPPKCKSGVLITYIL
jgi:hypothetical protein